MSQNLLPTHTPVLIVGAGSTGMAAAMELSRQGVPVTLIDASESHCTESRGTGLTARTVELLEMYGLSDDLVRLGNPIRRIAMFLDRQSTSSIELSLAATRFDAPPALPQNRTEGLLRGKLASHGVQPLWGHSLVALDQRPDGVRATVRLPGGEEAVVHAGWVIGADGARSATRRLLNFPFEGKSYPEGWGLLDVDLEWDEPAGDEVRNYRLSGTPQLYVVVPLGGTYYRLQMNHRDPELAGKPPTLAEMQAGFDRFVGKPAKITAPAWASSFNIHLRQVVNYRSGRVFLAGDAAHIHTPAGGQGLNTGIQDGLNLAWKMAQVVRGDADEALLETYETERKPIATGVLELSDALAHRPEELVKVHASPAAVATRVSQIMVSYNGGPLGQPQRGEGQLRAGDRLPDVLLDGGQRVYASLRDGRIVLALVGARETTRLAARAWEHRLPQRVAVWELAPDSPLAQGVGLAQGAFIVRPDAYLGLVHEGPTADAAETVVHWLEDVLLERPLRSPAPDDTATLRRRLRVAEDTSRALSESTRRLAARAEIVDAIHRYCRGLDRLDRDLMMSAFHPGAHVHFGEMFSGDAATFIDFAMKVQSRDIPVQHTLGNLFIAALSDTEATVETTEASHHPATGGGGDMLMAARLIDRFECRQGQWRIVQRTKVVDWSRLLPGADDLLAKNKLQRGRRDHEDPSYALLALSGAGAK